MLALIPVILSFIKGPLFSIIDKLIPDASLKERLKSEIDIRLLQSDDRLAELQRDLLTIELRSESWLTRSWRPMLMYLIMLMLAVYGLLLPMFEAMFGKLDGFEPRWHQFPDGLWTLLMLGVGGYIGGRTVEKLVRAGISARPPQADEDRKQPAGRRRNFNK
jgi:hypothetical protein